MVAVIAAMRRLVAILNAMTKRNQDWNPRIARCPRQSPDGSAMRCCLNGWRWGDRTEVGEGVVGGGGGAWAEALGVRAGGVGEV